MNKIFGTGPDGQILLCILEPGNINGLVDERRPIEINLNEGPWKKGLPPKIKIVLGYSETPIADAKDFMKQHPDVPMEDQRTPVSEKKKPHCPECKSTIEQLGVWRSEEAPLWISFCYVCGCVLGTNEPIKGLEK